MFPTTAVPPMPPQISQQQQPAMPPSAMFGQIGAAMPMQGADPQSLLEGQVAKLESWAQETVPLVQTINPALQPLLAMLVKVGNTIKEEVARGRQQTAGPSPTVMGSVPPNVPGNIPSSAPAM